MLNGKNGEGRDNLYVRPLECIAGSCNLNAVEDSKIPLKSSPWSDKNSWASKKLPVDGDEVEILNTQWIELDLAETPKLKKLTINGRLSIKSDKDKLAKIKLRSFLIWVRAGELIVGSAETPFAQDFEIELLGETESETLQLDGFTKAGNKVLVSNNKIEMYGKPRVNMERLIETAEAGKAEIKINSTHSDWLVGDRIYISTSTIQHNHSEYRNIKKIEKGVITLDKPLTYYHYGAAKSTADIYNGVDIRTEVLLLSRNVRIKGEEKDGWAGHVLVSDLIEGENTRYGTILLSSVEIDNCS